MDIAARIIASWLSKRLGQSFFVENQPGESGNRATRAVVLAPSDGSVLLLCGPVNTINTTLFRDLDFDFAADTAPVAALARVPLVIEVHPSVPARTLPEFLALAKARPGEIKVAYAGRGTPQHVGIELLKMMAGVDLSLVPYAGSTPALSDLLEGQAHAMFDPMPSSLAHVRSGRLIPLAVTGPARSEALPGIPAVGEFMPGYEAGSWFGIVAPKDTPPSVVGTLNEAVNAGLREPEVLTRLAEVGATPFLSTPAEFGSFIHGETDRFAKVIRAANIKAE